ncbi:hypothetical protein SAMN06272737_12463 [Blastococcus mobilis]|uniref:NAD dependent epimerase/dehydratase family protein n=1 Tax=Blastococcus mobilis TaxID=1938746 RepID=A0A238Z3Q7_9ACTN|nr:hypothetical protein SAMN06272737_12463 [Blastococcus mobilis]
MRMLLTGGAGFIGANFVHYTLRKHPEHAITWRPTRYHAVPAPSRARVRGTAPAATSSRRAAECSGGALAATTSFVPKALRASVPDDSAAASGGRRRGGQ